MARKRDPDEDILKLLREIEVHSIALRTSFYLVKWMLVSSKT